jgi:hypothetical protein
MTEASPNYLAENYVSKVAVTMKTALLTHPSDPTSMKKALKHLNAPKWRRAMNDEQSLE